MEHLTHIQAPVNHVTVLRHSKTSGWNSTEVLVPDSTDYTSTKHMVLAGAYVLMGACCHCPAMGTGIALLSFRAMEPDQKTAKRFFMLVDHCSDPICTHIAAAVGNAGLKEIADGTALGAQYKCSACTKTSPTMPQCTGCHLARYCSTECERADSARHKPYCHAKE